MKSILVSTTSSYASRLVELGMQIGVDALSGYSRPWKLKMFCRMAMYDLSRKADVRWHCFLNCHLDICPSWFIFISTDLAKLCEHNWGAPSGPKHMHAEDMYTSNVHEKSDTTHQDTIWLGDRWHPPLFESTCEKEAPPIFLDTQWRESEKHFFEHYLIHILAFPVVFSCLVED